MHITITWYNTGHFPHVYCHAINFYILTRGINIQVSQTFGLQKKRHYIYDIISIIWRHMCNDVIFWQNDNKKCTLLHRIEALNSKHISRVV